MHYQGSASANPSLLTSHQLGAASSAALEQQLRLSSDGAGGYLGTQSSNRLSAHPSAASLQPMNGGLQSMHSGAQPMNSLQPSNGGLQSMQSGVQPMNSSLQQMNSGLQSMQSGQMGGSIAGSHYKNQNLNGSGPYDHSGGFVSSSGLGGGSSAFGGSVGGSFYGNDGQVASGTYGSHAQQFGSQAVDGMGEYERSISGMAPQPSTLLHSQAGGVAPHDVHNSSGQAS